METVASGAGIVLLLGVICLGYLVFRRVRLMRGGGVDVCLRRQGQRQRLRRRPVRVSRDAAAGWHFGVGRYQGNEFAWYRLTSLRPGATAVLDRAEVEIIERRHLVAGETYVLPQAASVLRCRSGDREIELAMTPGVLTGFLSWLESAPPGPSGSGYRVAS